MKFVMFYHSLISDWNHGNAHFLRGVVSELLERGHDVDVYEPDDGWSLSHLRMERGEAAVQDFHAAFPELRSLFYRAATLDLDEALDGADAVIVHEWNEPELIARIGERAARVGCKALFHDTHHRCMSSPQAIAALDLRHYEGVLAFGRSVADCYSEHGWASAAWVWHEAADLRHFQPRTAAKRQGDLIWIGNWGDGERSAELVQYLLDPVARLGLDATVHGVRYPAHALDMLRRAGIRYGGWLPNYKAPTAFAGYRCTVHVPRQIYSSQLRGVPTIRMFEALSCGIPLISAPWHDDEHLFRTGVDYLVANTGRRMEQQLRAVMNDAALATSLVEHGLETIRTRHSCAQRVDELLSILGASRGARVLELTEGVSA